MNRFDEIEKKLSKLDNIDKSVQKINCRLDKINTKVQNLEKIVADVEKSRQFDSSNITDIQRKQGEIHDSLEKMKKIEREQREANEKLKREIIDLKCRSKRDN